MTRDQFIAFYDGLGEIERELMHDSMSRIREGQTRIGLLRDSDPRDWLIEALEEMVDKSHYLQLEVRRLRRERDALRKTDPCPAPHNT